ncbi:hypothetical protein SteCoe_21045 [Stentor coeruleus]|uniref:Uncharacterized protein n=1 Tax=Stentor coeruleus TaxID=5963 RepID=A0A1R2BQJ8_9CILI|nr:hypothetical protein SteCoe_21045 [Stentor coeruleus]
MIKGLYSKDNAYLRLLEKERSQRRIKESNRIFRKFSDETRIRLKRLQNSLDKGSRSFSNSSSSPLSPKINSVYLKENKSTKNNAHYSFKIMQSIIDKSKEYEKEIQRFLGVDKTLDDALIKRSKLKLQKILPIKKPINSYVFKHTVASDLTWVEALKKIETKEKRLKKNLLDLDSEQKKIKKKSHSTKPNNKLLHSEAEIYKSLNKVNQLLSKVLHTPSPSPKAKKFK